MKTLSPKRKKRVTLRLVVDPVAAARAATLRYVNDADPGIRRKKAGRGFTYIGPDGKTVRSRETLRRIRSLVIPPAWNDVWICTCAEGHLQATGRDARGRKQYRYHPRWREIRDETKYGRLLHFGTALPRIRRRVQRDLAQPGIPRTKALAILIQLLERTLIRVGNEEYARTNGSFGLTTLRDRHAVVRGDTIRFRFRGKSGVVHTVNVADRRLARLVKRCQDLPGQSLLQYLDEEGNSQPLDSSDVNDYLREISGDEFTTKDFRTWTGTLLVARFLCTQTDCESQTARKKAINEAIRAAAGSLGNTIAVCRKCYVHPAVIDAFLEGRLAEELQASSATAAEPSGPASRAEETALMRFLEKAMQARGRQTCAS